MLDQIDIAGAEPLARLPQHPARHIGARCGVRRIGVPVAGLLCAVNQNGVGLPQHQAAIDEGRQFGVRINGPECRLLVVAAEIAEQFAVVTGADKIETGHHFAAIHGYRIVVEFHRAPSRLTLRATVAPTGPPG